MNSSPEQNGKILQAVEVCKTYKDVKNPLKVLQNTDMHIKRGERLAIIGASGVGKSTLLHILGGLDKPDSGKILFNDEDIYAQTPEYLDLFRNRNIGFVFQFFNLLPEFNVLENVQFPALIGNKDKTKSTERAKMLLDEVGLFGRLDHKPGELSGGETQRVALARALINEPNMVLADEPTGNLDAKSSDKLIDLIAELNQKTGQTFVIVTHSHKIAHSLDRVLELTEGKINKVENGL
jgi:lipoprotein-releasing system ATP-binding protein